MENAEQRPDLDDGQAIAPTLRVRDMVHGFIVKAAVEDAAPGMREVLAEGCAGESVILRVPTDRKTASRMRDEADLARAHAHRSIVQTVALAEYEAWPVQILEHVDGMGLDILSLVGGALTAEAACRVGWQTAGALSELHAKNPVVAHGALSSARIVVDTQGNARLRDVGRLSPDQADRLMSPERREDGAGPSAADDIYALGITIAEVALGYALEIEDGFLDVRVLDGLLPERIIDAIAVLVAPKKTRITNAAAALRILAELEYAFGDGLRALRSSLERARLGLAFGGLDNTLDDDEDDLAGPITLSDGLSPATSAGDPRKALVREQSAHTALVVLASSLVALMAMAAGAFVLVNQGIVKLPQQLASLSMPDAHAPDFKMPDVHMPDFKMPDMHMPDFKMPDVHMPDFKMPDVHMPSVTLPSLSIADVVKTAATDAEPAANAAADDHGSAPPPVATVDAAAAIIAAAGAMPAGADAPVVASTPVFVTTTSAPKKPAHHAAASVAVDAVPSKIDASKVESKIEAPKVEPSKVEPKEVEAAGPAVQLVLAIDEGARASAESKLRACHINGTVVGVVHASAGTVTVSSQPKNACAERTLKHAVGKLADDDEPYQIVAP